MVGVAETVFSKALDGNRKLIIHMQWDNDEDFPTIPVEGTLPGRGVVSFLFGIRKGDDLDFDIIQEWNFRGGGDVKYNFRNLESNFALLPTKVRDAFNQLYEEKKSGQPFKFFLIFCSHSS